MRAGRRIGTPILIVAAPLRWGVFAAKPPSVARLQLSGARVQGSPLSASNKRFAVRRIEPKHEKAGRAFRAHPTFVKV